MQNESKIPTPLNSADLEAVLAEAKLHWPKRELPPLTAREVDALENGAKVIPLTQGKWAIVDAGDYCLFLPYNWAAQKVQNGESCYAKRNIKVNKKVVRVTIHGVLTKQRHPFVADHKNGDTLDNRQSNLRLVRQNQNAKNRGKHKITSSKYKGVSRKYYKHAPNAKPWASRIMVEGKPFHIGYYWTEEDAARAYDAAAKIMHGLFARFNFPVPEVTFVEVNGLEDTARGENGFGSTGL